MNDDKRTRYKLQRHLWPDEIEARRKQRFSAFIMIVSLVIVFAVGWVLGSFMQAPQASIIDTPTNSTFANAKLEAIYSIMEDEWYFGKDDPELSEHLIDAALYGMSQMEADLHTTYMSREEIQSFSQSIDMGFVGIGVQYVTMEGMNIIDRVFKESPAEKAGVLPGDILFAVDGVPVEGLASEEIAAMVKGEEGSSVAIEFIRQGEHVTLDIVRAAIDNTVYGYMIDEDTGYLEMYQFGSTTATEVRKYLESMQADGMTTLILDLRDNGGGYLDPLVEIAGMFIPEGEIVIQQESRSGRVTTNKTKGGMLEGINKIIILMNENTASASEALIMSLKEQRDDVTLVGSTTYGKGSVQVQRPFADGSVLKYTNARWLSPDGNWINDIGIEPDVDVKQHDVMYMSYVDMADDQVYGYDQVGVNVAFAQECLDFLGYSVGRLDGYYDRSTETAVKAFQTDIAMTGTGELDKGTFEALISKVRRVWSTDKSTDVQYQLAVGLANE